MLSFEAPPLPPEQTVSYTAECSLSAPQESVVVGDANQVLPDTSYTIVAAPGRALACAVTASVEVGEGTYTATSESISVSAGTVAATAITLLPDAGGFMIQVARDAGLYDPSIVKVFVTCTQSGATIVGPSQEITGIGLSVETDSQDPVSCTASSTLNIGIDSSSLSTIFVNDVDTVTPEEALLQPMPIWLLYQATQSGSSAGQTP